MAAAGPDAPIPCGDGNTAPARYEATPDTATAGVDPIPWPGRPRGTPATVPARSGGRTLSGYMVLETVWSQPTAVSLRQAVYLYPLLIWKPLV